MATRDKLIFPLAITRILRHFSVPFPVFDHFHVMCAIDAAIVKQSEAQLRSRPSTSIPSSSTGSVTLKDIMAQLVRMDARLDTLSYELCQVNTHVGRIARQQAVMGGFVDSPPLTPEAFEDEDDDADVDAEDAEDDDADVDVEDAEDDGAGSSSADEMST